jgi:ribosomal protein L2
MGIRKLNPVTAGTRHKVITDFEGITTRVPEASLTCAAATRAAAATTQAR